MSISAPQPTLRAAPRRERLLRHLRAYLAEPNCPESLPSEQELSERFAVSRKTLRLAFDTLEKENVITRIHGKGTFRTRVQAASIYVLVPCVHFATQSGIGPIRRTLLLQQMLMAAATPLNHRVVPVPFSRTNRPDDVDFEALSLIEPDAPVFVGAPWYEAGFEFLARRTRRVALFGNRIFTHHRPYFPGADAWLKLCVGHGDLACAIPRLIAMGSKRPAVVVADPLTDMAEMFEEYRDAVRAAGLEPDPALLLPWQAMTPEGRGDGGSSFVAWLNAMQRDVGFDGMHLTLPPDYGVDLRYSLPRNLGLPEGFPIVTQCEYLFSRLVRPMAPFVDYDFERIGQDAVTRLLAADFTPETLRYEPFIRDRLD